METIFHSAWEEMNAELDGNLEKRIHIGTEEMAVAQCVVNAINEEVFRVLNSTSYAKYLPDKFDLHGSVAEGTKVMDPNEFDYSILIDLSAKDWEILPLKLTSIENKCLIDDSQKEFFWSIMRRNAVRKGRIAQRLRNTQKIIDHSLVKQCSSSIDNSAEQFYFSFINYISNLKTFCSDTFLISDIESNDPAITLKVLYQSGINSLSMLSVDYVPTVKIGKRHFVAKRMPYVYKDLEDSLRNAHDHSKELKLFYWRESFSCEELTLMNKIRTEAEPFIRLFKQIKTVSFHIENRELSCCCYLGGNCRAGTSSGFLSCNTFFEWSNLHLRTYHFKTVLFHMYRLSKRWRGSDPSSLITVYFQLLSEYCNRKCLPNYFNGKNLLFR